MLFSKNSDGRTVQILVGIGSECVQNRDTDLCELRYSRVSEIGKWLYYWFGQLRKPQKFHAKTMVSAISKERTNQGFSSL